ncbi:ATP synthase protein I [Humidesulfovibrio mexicanus]|jgi:ATP synthase protein I|uniref:ATP synthase protein I n=1 Tax=Humidesulfovibrio mexicanus TaxID=147047 RepID=A0A239CRI7_9BACT|nr:AtpZ/AtpI family protein [Humidesulfovibrio mexicanus]SNS22876.1 ATP synthase protein I [Humidesulfovibrio mexicanus]
MFFPKQGKQSGALELFYVAGTIGLQLVSATFIGLAMGYFLDKWLGTSPWLLVVFLLLGIVAGFRDVYREARRIQRRTGEGTGKDGQEPGK